MDDEYKNITLTIIVALAVSMLLSIALMVSVVPSYLHNTNRAVNIFDFYEHINGSNNIYFIGSSQIGCGVDTRIIEKHSGVYRIYNLGLSADNPLRRMTEISQLTQTRPYAVIIGLTYFGLCDEPLNGLHDDNIATVADKIKVDSDIFTKDEMELINANTIIYDRKFFLPGILGLIRKGYIDSNWNWNITNFTAPESLEKNSTYQELIDKLKDGTWLNRFTVSEKDNRQKRALNYTIRELQKAGVHVTIISMPLNPLLSSRIPNESRRNYFKFLDSTDVPYYDFERAYSGEYFFDLTHLNCAGRKAFSEELCYSISNMSLS